MNEVFKLFGTIGLRGADQTENELESVTDKAESSSGKIAAAFKKIGLAVAAAFTVNKIKEFGVAVVQTSAEVAAEEAAFAQIMGTYSDEAAAKVSKIAEATGMVDTRLTPYMTSMTAKFKGLGYDVEEATDLASVGLNIAADAAAFWDKSLTDSMSSLNSFVNGNYEGGEAIGLFANETTLATWASQNLDLEWKNLTEKEKQFARLQFAKSMQEASGAAGQAAKESGAYQNVMGNLTEAWRQFKAQIGEPLLQNIVIPAMKWLGDFITNTLSPAFQNLKDKIAELNALYQEHKTIIDIAAAAIGSLAAAVLSYNTYVAITNRLLKEGTLLNKLWSTAVALATGKIKLVTIAQKALNLVMSLNPIGLVIAAIAALVAIFVVAYKKSEAFRNVINKLWGVIKNSLIKVLEELKPFINGVIQAFSEFVDAVMAEVMPIIEELWKQFQELWRIVQPIIKIFADYWKKIFMNKLYVVKTAFNQIVIAIKTALNIIKNVIKLVTSIIKGDWKGAWEAIKGIFSSYLNGIKETANNILGGIKKIFSNTFEAIKGVVKKMKDLFNFEWSLPKLKVPKFNISPKGWKVGDLLKGKIPKLGVTWNADGAIFNRPAIFDTAYGLQGVGEAGPEAVAPINKLQDYVRNAVKEENSGLEYQVSRLYAMLANYFPQIISNMDREVVLDTGALVGQLAPAMDARLGTIYARKERGR